MNTAVYRVRDQTKIVYPRTLLSKLFSPLTWNWFIFGEYWFDTGFLDTFLRTRGRIGNRFDYYVRINGGNYGIVYLLADRVIFVINRLLWEVPYPSLKNIAYRPGNGILREPKISVDFIYEGTTQHFTMLVPLSDPQKQEVDLSNNNSPEQTESLYNELLKNSKRDQS